MSERRSRGRRQPSEVAAAEPVSLKVLAGHLGLSPGTVSLVLNSSPGFAAIPERTRQRIFDGARELNYRPNYFARALSLKRSFMIGVLTTSLSEGYDSMLLAGIERYLLETDYVYFVASHLWSETQLLRSLRTLLERGAEGVILINAEPPEMAVEIPLLRIGAGRSRSGISTIAIDNKAGARLLLHHLYELGHRKIAYLMGDRHGLDTRQRWEGFKETSKELGLLVDRKLIAPAGRRGETDASGIEHGAASVRRLLERTKDFTAVVCFNDMSAIGALHQLRMEGIAVPSQVSVVGFDDISFAQATNPALTTIRQPLLEMGILAATRMVKQIERKAGHAVSILLPQLVVRQSSGAVRSVSLP